MSEYNKKNLVTKLPDEDVVRITEHYDVGKFKTFQVPMCYKVMLYVDHCWWFGKY